jgi:hypothetical protein
LWTKNKSEKLTKKKSFSHVKLLYRLNNVVFLAEWMLCNGVCTHETLWFYSWRFTNMKKVFYVSLLSVFVLEKNGIYIDILTICFRLSVTCWLLMVECFTVNLISLVFVNGVWNEVWSNVLWKGQGHPVWCWIFAYDEIKSYI